MKSKVFPIALLALALIHFAHIVSLPVLITHDGHIYIDLADVLFSPRYAAEWDVLRGPLYPLGLKLAFVAFGRGASAPIVLGSLFGFAGVVLLGLALRRLAGDGIAATFLLVATLFPALIVYEHSVLTEAGTFFILALLTYLLATQRPGTAGYGRAAALGLVAGIGYFYRGTVFYLAPAAAIIFLLAGLDVRRQGWSRLRAVPRQWKQLLVSALLLLALPVALTWTSRAKVDESPRDEDVFITGLVLQAVIAPDDPVIGGLRERYLKAIEEASTDGRLRTSGISGEVFFPLVGHLMSHYSDNEDVFEEVIATYPRRYVAGVLRTLASFVGVPPVHSENEVFAALVFAPPGHSQILNGPAHLHQRTVDAFWQARGGASFLAPLLKQLGPLYHWLVVIAFGVTVASFAYGLVRLSPLHLALAALPVLYLVMHAIMLLSVNRYAFPTYPLALFCGFAVVAGMRSWPRDRRHRPATGSGG